jgi:tetratricopeptide (TPR) repeat protein
MAKDLAILHANKAAALIKLAMVEEAIKDCDKAVALDPLYVRAWARRASAHRQKEQLEEALDDWKKVLELEPGHGEAKEAIKVFNFCSLLNLMLTKSDFTDTARRNSGEKRKNETGNVW